MTIDVQNLVVVLGLVGTIAGMIAALYNLFARFEKLERQATHRKEDSKIIFKALVGVLDGLIEQGCNGPCHEARDMVVEYLTKN